MPVCGKCYCCPPCKSQRICRIAVALAVLATVVVAQTNATAWNTVKALTAGTEVRITTISQTVRGRIDRITDDALVVTSAKGQEMFDRQQITQVSVRSNGHSGRNALIGFGAGAGVGFGPPSVGMNLFSVVYS